MRALTQSPAWRLSHTHTHRYAISSINALVAELGREQAYRDSKKRAVVGFLRSHRVPRDVFYRVARQAEYHYAHESDIDRDELLGLLSSTTREELNAVLYRDL